MASLTKDNRLLFKAEDGKRKTIRLGKIPRKQALGIQRQVEHLIACQIDGSAPPNETTRWLAGVSDMLRGKLVRAGLLQPKVSGWTLGELIAIFKTRPKWQSYTDSTRDNNLLAYRELEAFFGSSKPIKQMTGADAMDWYDSLMAEGRKPKPMAVATANTWAKVAHTLFNYAVDSEVIDRNPFKKVPRAPRKGNNVNVSLQLSQQVLEAMPGTQGKLLFALARWGGLRVPSEPRALRWCDIDWENERMLVHSLKTKRHEGRETRWVPIFPEIATWLEKRFEEAEEGDVFVLPTLRAYETKGTSMIRTGFRVSGVEPWPRMWHSLRSTRETELVFATKDIETVCYWLNNSPEVARKHYIKYTEEHRQEVAQKAAQHDAAQRQLEKKSRKTAEAKSL